MEINIQVLKMRVNPQVFISRKDGLRIYTKFIIEVNTVGRKWLPYGTDDGIAKFDTEADAYAAIAKLKAAPIATESQT